MAETIKKRISDLDAASQPLGGTELAEISQGGVSKKVTLTNIFGSGWWAALRAAFSAFVAPEATHAVDSDTLEGESASDFHDAAQLTGAVPLASIPVELTGINAATATYADTAGYLDSVLGTLFLRAARAGETITIPFNRPTYRIFGFDLNTSTSAISGFNLSVTTVVPSGHIYFHIVYAP